MAFWIVKREGGIEKSVSHRTEVVLLTGGWRTRKSEGGIGGRRSWQALGGEKRENHNSEQGGREKSSGIAFPPGGKETLLHSRKPETWGRMLCLGGRYIHFGPLKVEGRVLEATKGQI